MDGQRAYYRVTGDVEFHDEMTKTLRDEFAMAAMAGLFRHGGWVNTIDGDEEEIAIRAYVVADAMLAARKKES